MIDTSTSLKRRKDQADLNDVVLRLKAWWRGQTSLTREETMAIVEFQLFSTDEDNVRDLVPAHAGQPQFPDLSNGSAQQPEPPEALEGSLAGASVDERIRKTVYKDRLYCLECGKPFKILRRHLRQSHNMSPIDYVNRWGLPYDYPMVAEDHHNARQEQMFNTIKKRGSPLGMRPAAGSEEAGAIKTEKKPRGRAGGRKSDD
ncbi:MucR family transcriptional regulator [Xanthobacter autotrophicus]|uniref:MucR family transcriptional regulator n=1 Tax=Xanthobacter dioxanivorans TaxID=2528964 RepID=A0A974PVT8_9HYPH|nr:MULTISPECIES: MucR family transcriptional regulator [Xanthobacter]QRG10203.1 MucR family transcriptional regulator [Xanthobacter dioxanivorans]UDQ88562.1 MucR family transcriptional regulator [Xanthobacter autotrophicus]